MNILSKVTRISLLKNKVRTVVTVAGILLSAAMITAVTVSADSFRQFIQDSTLASGGNWHAAFYNVDAAGREALEQDPRLDSAAWAQVSWAHYPEKPEEQDYPYLTVVMGVDSAFMERMPISLSKGRFPENPGEIVLSESALGERSVRLGDTLTLSLGERMLDGEIQGFDSGHWEGETLSVRETRTYTVVGYLSGTRFAWGSYADMVGLTVWDSSENGALLNGYTLLKDPKETYAFQKDYDQYPSKDNQDYLMTLGVSRYENFLVVLYSFAAILIGLIMFGSVSLIYNAFSISVAQRTKEFGLLRSLGATKKQLRSMVFTEALTVSAVGIPLGALAGLLGMAVTFRFIGSSLEALIGDTASDTLGAPALSLRVTPLPLIAAAVIGLVTVLISAWIPSRRATRVSAIEAIREARDVRIKPREVKTSPLTYKLFGLEGVIAGKHFKRNRKGYRATVVSLFMSVVLFISASSFCRYLTDMVTGIFEDYDYDIVWTARFPESLSGEQPDQALGKMISVLSKTSCVTDSSAMILMGARSMMLTREDVPEEALERVFNHIDMDIGHYVSLEVYAVEDETYRAYLREQGLPEEEFMGEDPKIIVRAEERIFNMDTQRIETTQLLRRDRKTLDIKFDYQGVDVGDLLDSEEYKAMTEEEQDEALDALTSFTRTYEIGAMCEELPFGLNGNWTRTGILVLLPMSEFLEVGRIGNWTDEFFYPSLYFNVSDHKNGLAEILAAAQDAGFEPDENDFTDILAETAGNRAFVTVVRVVSYGFITLISLIAALNVFNTISTNILLRRREFAMLRSVGMTNRGFNKMMNFECLLYGAKSLLFGIPAAFGVTFLIYRAVMRGMDTGFYLPWSAVAVAVGSVFLVVFLSMLYSMSGIKRDDPIEAMKNEVI